MRGIPEVQREAILADYVAGATVADIAEKHGVGRDYAAKVARSRGLHIRTRGHLGSWTPENDAILRRMAAAKHSAGQIGAVIGVSRNAVISRARRVGAKMQGGPARQPAGADGAAKAPTERKPTKRQVAVAAVTSNVVQLPATVPMTFLEAIEANRCLFFHGDRLSEDGPNMPVCGAERMHGELGVRVCARHYLLQYQPKERAA